VLEKVTGLSWDEVLRREALAPLGMAGAALRLDGDVERRLARGYHTGQERVPYWSFYHRPAGSLMASPRELAAIVKLGLGRGRVGDTTLVSPEGMARIERPETARVDAGAASYGLGNYGEVVGPAPTRGHAGGLPGFLSDYAYVPRHDVGFVLLLNSTASGRALADIRHELLEFLLRGVPRPPPPPPAPVPEAELARWAGSYHFAAPRHQLFAFLERTAAAIVVAFDAGKLWLVLPSGRRLELVPAGGDRFRVTFAAGSHLVFGRDAEGRRVFVDHNHYFVEEPAWRSWLFHRLPPMCVWILASAILLPLGRVGARRSARGVGWPLAASLSFFAATHAFIAAFSGAAGTFNWNTLGVFVFTLSFAVASLGSAWDALVAVRRRALPPLALAYRLAFAAAACATTAYLAAYGLIGLRLWSY
jgi:hypothetical protein